MSALLAHAKALEALAAAFYERVRVNSIQRPVPEYTPLLNEIGLAHEAAARALREQAREEASGPAFEDRPPAAKGRRT